jgi:hypothetical protein
MAGSTEFNVWYPCDTVLRHISVAERAVQLSHLFVMNMIKGNGLIDRLPGKDWKDGKEEFLR